MRSSCRRRRSRTKTSDAPFVSPATRFVAPSSEGDEAPVGARSTVRRCRRSPRLRRRVDAHALGRAGRAVAHEDVVRRRSCRPRRGSSRGSNATKRPSAEIDGQAARPVRLRAGASSTLTRSVVPVGAVAHEDVALPFVSPATRFERARDERDEAAVGGDRERPRCRRSPAAPRCSTLTRSVVPAHAVAHEDVAAAVRVARDEVRRDRVEGDEAAVRADRRSARCRRLGLRAAPVDAHALGRARLTGRARRRRGRRSCRRRRGSSRRSNATKRPSAEIAGSRAAAVRLRAGALTLTRSVVPPPGRARRRRAGGCVSPATRFVASDSNATKRPSALIAPAALSPFAGTAVPPFASTPSAATALPATRAATATAATATPGRER